VQNACNGYQQGPEGFMPVRFVIFRPAILNFLIRRLAALLRRNIHGDWGRDRLTSPLALSPFELVQNALEGDVQLRISCCSLDRVFRSRNRTFPLPIRINRRDVKKLWSFVL
jgi:hypothetical protein